MNFDRTIQKASGRKDFENERGRASVEFLRPNVGRLTFAGHVTADLAAPALEALSAVFAAGQKAWVLNDFSELVSYESTVRLLCTKWVARNHQHIEESLLYARSPTVRMGVTIANLALRPQGRQVHLFTDEVDFRAAAGRVLRSADGLG